MQDAVVAAGCTPVLVGLTSSPDEDVRGSAVLALQNLSFMAEQPVRSALMSALPWSLARALTTDPQPSVKVRPP